MYKNISQRYKDIIYNSSVQSVVNIYIDGVLLNPKYLTDFKMGCELFNDNFELGSVPSQYIEMQIHKNSGITNPKKIKIEYGILVNNALTVAEVNSMLVKDFNNLMVRSLAKEDKSFEIIPIGIYNVDDYNTEDDNVINVKALDNIIKLDADDGYYDASELIKKKGYATLGEIAQDICNKKGLELETSSFLNSDKKVSVYDNQLKAREYMSYIAECAGCFCCANRVGKIVFRKIGQDEVKIPLKLFKNYKFGEEYKISRVAFEDGVRSFKFGNEIRNTLWIRQDNIFVTDEIEIQNIYNEIKDLTINSFEGSVIIDPAIDIGDKIKIGDKYIIYQGEMTLNKRFIADIKSKISIKQKEETTVKKESQKVINRRVQSEINQIDGKITQLAEENTETSNKLSEHEQTIDSMKDTLKSQETKIETVENKADIAQSTADSATTKANNAQTSANNAQTTANTANTNAQNAQKTADANTTKITTNTTKIAEVEKTVDGITQSVSKVEEKVETVESKADNAQSTANTAKSTADKVNDDLNTKYYTKTETENKLTQTAESTISEVSKTYSTKTETANAKTEAINSANSSTDNKLKDYTVTSKLGTFIEQNYEYIKYAWNQISQYLKMEGIDGKATLNIYDENNKMLMSLNQDGQTFFDTSGKKIGTVGIVRENNKDTLAFGMNVDWNSVSESKSMAWGYFDKNGKFLPIFHLVGTYGGEGSEYGGELAVEGTLSTDSLKVIKGTLESGETSFNVIDSNGNSLISVTQHVEGLSKVFDSSIQGRTYFPDGLVVLEGIGFHHGNPVIDIEGNTVLCRVSGSDIAFYANGQFVNYLYSSTSDKRLKSNFKEVPDDLLKIIDELKIQQFNVNNREKINFGIIAQDFIEYCNQNNINPEEYEILGRFKKQIDDDTEYYKIDYTQFLILKQLATDKKIKELQEKDKQKDEIITDLIKRIETLEKEVNK